MVISWILPIFDQIHLNKLSRHKMATVMIFHQPSSLKTIDISVFWPLKSVGSPLH
jgi:hypothetical protein